MRVVPTSVHGVVDYVWSLLLLSSPWVLGYADASPATWLPVAFGLAGILYSLGTDYELGLFPLIGMRTHLGIDLLAGVSLAASPWLFGFAGRVCWPHLAFGLFAVAASLLTETQPASAGNIASARV